MRILLAYHHVSFYARQHECAMMRWKTNVREVATLEKNLHLSYCNLHAPPCTPRGVQMNLFATAVIEAGRPPCLLPRPLWFVDMPHGNFTRLAVVLNRIGQCS